MKKLLKVNEFEKRFLYIERDLIRENKFSIAKSELGKIIHDAKINNLSEVLDRARELLRFCNIKEREFFKKVDKNYSLNDDEELVLLKRLKIKEKLSKGKNLIFQKKILEGKKLLENVIQESSSLSSSFIYSQASEILDYCEIFVQNKKVFINIEDLIEEKKYSTAETRLKDLIEKIESYIGDKEILNKEILNKALILLDNIPNLLEKNVNKLNIRNFIQNLSNVNEFPKFMLERSKLFGEMYSFYNKYKNYENANEKMINLFIQFYSPYFKINPFEIEIQFFIALFKNWKDSELRQLKNIVKENIELENLYNKLEKIDYNFMIDKEIEKIAEEIKELNYDVPLENMYNFLLDFSQIIIDPYISKIGELKEDQYTLKTSQGLLDFKIMEKKPGKLLVYDYDFLSSTYGEKGRFFINLAELAPGKVTLKIRNEIQEISKETREQLWITNLLGKYLHQYIEMNLGKIVAKQIQAILYEKNFDDLTIGNYKILQAKISAMGKNIDKLNTKYFEVKAPLTLTSFNCSECGATLNIISKKEKFIICGHCDTPFLMEWQRY